MAWYATSLVPRTVVFGIAVHVLFMYSVVALSVMSFATPFGFLLRRWRPAVRSGKRKIPRWRYVILTPLVAIVVLAVLAIIWVRMFPNPLVYRVDPYYPTDMFLLAAFALLTVTAGIVCAWTISKHYGERPFVRSIFAGCAAAYVITVAAALCVAAIEYPALPRVQLQLSQEAETRLKPHAPPAAAYGSTSPRTCTTCQ